MKKGDKYKLIKDLPSPTDPYYIKHFKGDTLFIIKDISKRIVLVSKKQNLTKGFKINKSNLIFNSFSHLNKPTRLNNWDYLVDSKHLDLILD